MKGARGLAGVQAWRVGDERAESYLRLLAEAELRRAGDQLRGLDAAAGTDESSDPGMAPFRVAESAHWRVTRAGRILAAAGALDWDFLDRFAHELFSASTVRSRIHLSWYRRQGVLHAVFAPESGQALPSGRADTAIRVTPIGRTLGVPGECGPSALHLMSLVRTGTEAMITVVMRMHRSLDRTLRELAFTRAGLSRLSYDQLWARSRARSSRCSRRRARSPPIARSPVSLPRCVSGSARPGTASPSLRQRRSRRTGPASSRIAPRRCLPTAPRCSHRWPVSSRTS